MDINKHLEFLNPKKFDNRIHIIGVGAVGSRVAEQLARLGFTNIHIYDFDKVEAVNIPNQLFVNSDIGKDKVDAVEEHMKAINPRIEVTKHPKGWNNNVLDGAVFIAVDSIELRRKITESIMYNPTVKVVFDGRMRLTDAQYYGADWKEQKQRDILLGSMQFTDADADESTPVSACGTTLSVVPTVVSLASVVVANFINYVNGHKVQNLVLIDPFHGILNAITY